MPNVSELMLFCYIFSTVWEIFFGGGGCFDAGNHNFFISHNITHAVLMEILEPLLLPSISKNKIVTQSWLHPSASFFVLFLFIFLLSFSFVACRLLLLYHENIFEKRNVHECLLCPPHWNTWGKVSSLTLWLIPAPQLEPQRLVLPLPTIFFSWNDGQFQEFPHDAPQKSNWTLNWLDGASSSKNLQDPVWCVWISGGDMVVCCRRFECQFLWLKRLLRWGGGATGFWGEKMAFYVA